MSSMKMQYLMMWVSSSHSFPLPFQAWQTVHQSLMSQHSLQMHHQLHIVELRSKTPTATWSPPGLGAAELACSAVGRAAGAAVMLSPGIGLAHTPCNSTAILLMWHKYIIQQPQVQHQNGWWTLTAEAGSVMVNCHLQEKTTSYDQGAQNKTCYKSTALVACAQTKAS